jgi:hypothetical protein
MISNLDARTFTLLEQFTSYQTKTALGHHRMNSTAGPAKGGRLRSSAARVKVRRC